MVLWSRCSPTWRPESHGDYRPLLRGLQRREETCGQKWHSFLKTRDKNYWGCLYMNSFHLVAWTCVVPWALGTLSNQGKGSSCFQLNLLFFFRTLKQRHRPVVVWIYTGMEVLALTVMGRGQECRCFAARVVSLQVENPPTPWRAEENQCMGAHPRVCLWSMFAADLEAHNHLGVNSALAESSPSREGAQPWDLWSGSNFPFLVELPPRWLCLDFSSMLLRVLGPYNYYLILGSGLNGLSGRIMVMRIPANVNFLHFTWGSSVPLPWTPASAEPGSYCSDWSHVVWEIFFFISTELKHSSRLYTFLKLTYIKTDFLFLVWSYEY